MPPAAFNCHFQYFFPNPARFKFQIIYSAFFIHIPFDFSYPYCRCSYLLMTSLIMVSARFSAISLLPRAVA